MKSIQCQDIYFDSMVEEPQADYLDIYGVVPVEINQVSQFDYCSSVSTTY